MDLSLRPSTEADLPWLLDLRVQALKPDLERLGRFNEERVRQRMREAFQPAQTRIILRSGGDVGSITVRVDGQERWIEHFYLQASARGRGIGTLVLRIVLAEPFRGSTRLNVLQGSAARTLYERHSFVVDASDDIDAWMTWRPDLAVGGHG